MAKFYVQSGTVRQVVQAEDACKAAIWTVHLAMQQILPMYDDHELSVQKKCENALLEGFLVLSDEIVISERGFDRHDAWRMDTFDIVLQWNRLMIALAKIEQSLHAPVPVSGGAVGA